MIIKVADHFVQTKDIVFAEFDMSTDITKARIQVRHGADILLSGDSANYLQTILSALHVIHVDKLKSLMPLM